MNRTPILLDTDIGCNLDGLLTLSYLLCKPESELIGITTNNGDTKVRAAIAQFICQSLNHPSVAIHEGVAKPILYGAVPTLYSPSTSIPEIQVLKELRVQAQYSAVTFMRDTIRNRPGEITLITTGPLMNIALLFTIDPEIPYLLKNFITAAGSFMTNNNEERNAQFDPLATLLISRSKRSRHIWIGLDIAESCKISPSELPHSSITKLCHQLTPQVTTGVDESLHSTSTAISIFHPEFFEYRAGMVNVTERKGKTRFDGSSGVDHIATFVDSVKVVEELIKTIA
jgi:purine nucleosidase